MKDYRDLNNVIETAESKGEKRGIAKGKIEGELGKAREIAQTMLAKGLEVDFIAEITQLSKEEIEKSSLMFLGKGLDFYF